MSSICDPFQPRNRSRPEDHETIPRPRSPRPTPDPLDEIRDAAEHDVWSSDDPHRIRLAVDTLLALGER